IDVEPVFGFLKANLGFTRFSVRGKQKVKNELAFALMAVNLRKNAVMDGKIVAEDEKNTKKVPSKFFIAWNLFNLLFLASCVPASDICSEKIIQLNEKFEREKLRVRNIEKKLERQIMKTTVYQDDIDELKIKNQKILGECQRLYGKLKAYGISID
ncbi:transposase, partial [Oceanobacillus caeni]|uniref:transposase n=1 Tax=Oceanobacillus caeni TaxID=405946 RepID=UPI00362CB94D